MKNLTAADLKKLFPGLSRDKCERYAPHLSQAAKNANINTRARLCAFAAQVGHESQDLKYLREIWGPTPAQSRYDVRTDLGNTPDRDGDGKKYMGRGGIQRTGKNNYRRFQEATGVPVLDQPELLESPEYAFASDALFWNDNKLNRIADQLSLRGDHKDLDTFDRLTRKINGGYNGRVDRQRRYLAAIAALTDEFFKPEEPAKSSLDRVSEHVNAPKPEVDATNPASHATPPPVIAQNSPSDESEKSATHKILFEKLARKEGSKNVARSLGRRLGEWGTGLIALLAAGNVKAWIAVLCIGGLLTYFAIVERQTLKRKFDGLLKMISSWLSGT